MSHPMPLPRQTVSPGAQESLQLETCKERNVRSAAQGYNQALRGLGTE